MGAGIAYVSARAGFAVVLIDRDQASAEKGKALSAKRIGDEILKGRAKSAERAALIPTRRLGDPEDVAAMIAFLASAQARQVTGPSA